MKLNNTSQILLIEELSLLNFLFVLICGKKYSQIFYISRNTLMNYFSKFSFFLRLSPNNLSIINYSDLPGSYYTAEEEGYQTVIDSVFEKHKNNLYVKIALDFCKDPLFELAVKKEFFNRYTQRRLKTFTLIKYLLEKFSGMPFIVIPIDNKDIISDLSKSFVEATSFSIPKSVKYYNSVLSGMKTVFSLISFPVFLIAITIQFLFRGVDTSPAKKKYSVALDIFNEGINFNSPCDFFFLYDGKTIKPEKTLQVVRNRFDHSANAQRTHDFFVSRDYPYVEHDRLPIPIATFISCIGIGFFAGGCLSFIKRLFFCEWSSQLFLSSLAVMKMDISAEIFYHQYDVDVFVARDEYSPFHIVRTLVARSHKKRTLGFSHGDDCHHTGALNYLVFDRYAVWGDFYRRHLNKSLVHSKTEVIGAGIYGLDKTYGYIQCHAVPEPYRSVREKYRIIEIFGSSFSPDLYITKELTLFFYKTVLELTDQYTDCYRIIKPKNDEFNDPEFKNIINGHERVVVDPLTWTYELLPIADLIICINVSSVGLEGLMASKKVLYFDVTINKKHHVYAQYHPNLVAYTKNDLQRNINWVLTEGKYIQENLIQKIQRDHGFKFDGNVAARLRNICMNLVEEI